MKLYNAGIVLGILFGLACIAFGIWGARRLFFHHQHPLQITQILHRIIQYKTAQG